MSVNMLFLDVLKSAINDYDYDIKSPLSVFEYEQLFDLAEKHKLLPLVFDKLYDTYPYDKKDLDVVKSRVRFLLYRQVAKTDSTIKLYQNFNKIGIYPLIFKGIVCSSLYKKPDFRISSDEDILVRECDFDECVRVLENNGFLPDDAVNDCCDHLTFRNGQQITVELHKKLFVRDDSFFKKHNELFENVFDNSICININSFDIRTFNYTENLLYLILHCLKHFIGRGVGIRQLCDIIIFADKYGDFVDFDKLYFDCKSVNAEYYAAAIFKIGKKYLGKEIHRFYDNPNWRKIRTDEMPLLDDILSSGIYGKVTDSHALSGTFSFSMLKNGKNGIIKKIFCSSKDLNDRYAYAKKCPVLLPVAWVHKFFFLMTGKNRQKVDVVFKSMSIGKSRSKLFDLYNIKSS